jgi:transposase
MDRRNQLVSMLTEEKNRAQKSNGPTRPLLASIKRILKTLEAEIARLEEAIRKLVSQSKRLSAIVDVTSSVRGVGEVTAWSLIAYLPEIAQVGRSQLAALAGVAPYDDDSGKSSAPRHIHGGRSKARNAIYMATHVAATWNPVIKAYVQRLMARGKPYKCALVAAMRKMLIHIQSLIKKQLLTLES